MKAMIFAAGLGTRLKPFTNDRPKAMVEVNGKPMIGHLLHKLNDFGITEFVVNVHHFADVLCEYLNRPEFAEYSIVISDEREQLLDTGGGLCRAKRFFKNEDAVLVHNVDVWTDMDYSLLYDCFVQTNSMACLAVRDRKTSRYLLFNDNNEMIGWKNVKTGEIKMSRDESVSKMLAFSGIQIVSGEFINRLDGEGAFSIIDVYLEMAKHQLISAYNHSSDFWIDLGKPEAIASLKL